MKCKLVWNKSAKSRYKKTFSEVQNYIDNQCIKKMSSYVPVAPSKYDKAGKLKNSVAVTKPGHIVYTAKFAKIRYYDTHTPKRTGNPQGRRLWFEYMKSKHKDEILRGAAALTRSK